MIKRTLQATLLLMTVLSWSQNNSDWIDRTKHEGLFQLELTDKFEVYASLNESERIKNTVTTLEKAKKYYDRVFDENLNFAVLFVDDTNWNKYAFTPPPGMPQAYYEGNIVLGLGKTVMARNAERGLQMAPPPVQDLLKKHFGEPLNLDLFFTDALSIHELGHLYQFYRTGKKFQRRWLNELFGNLCQVGAARSFDTSVAIDRMDALQMTMSKGKQFENLEFKTLDQFENDYFKIMTQGHNYGWYQTQFYFKAKKLHAEFGDGFLTKFRKFLIDTNPEKIGILNNAALDKLLLESFGKDAMEIITWEF